MYNVFADQHHMSLYHSLHLLFEKRLGGHLYRPIGTEWMSEGYWKMAELYRNHPATVAQYLGLPADATSMEIANGIFTIADPQHGTNQCAITLEAFFKLPIDIVIATLPMHIESFSRLAAAHPRRPKFIYQIGNAWNVPAGSPVKNVMASAIIHDKIPAGVQMIKYHQEFETNIFYPAVEPPYNTVASFVNCFSTDHLFAGDWDLFQKVESMMPGWGFSCFGASCRDGSIGPAVQLADTMRSAGFIWHTKYGGDGYGHMIYNLAAVGRPLIVKLGYYMGKMGQELMRDGETCIAIDGLSPDQIVNKIKHFSQPDIYSTLCKRVRENFAQRVNFDAEFEQLKLFMEELL